MKKIILFLIIGISLAACSNEDDCCINIDVGISVKYLNEEGDNLFEIENGYNESDVTIYHKINGEWNEYYEANLDYPKGITLIDREDGKYLMIFPNTRLVDNNSETKIEFSNTDFDIIKTEIDNSNSNTIVTKVWYNDVLEWEAYETERMFEIIK